MNYNTCRHCKKATFETPNQPMVQYSPRHWAHWTCGIEKAGADFLRKLSPSQIRSLPFGVAREYAIVRAFLQANGYIAESDAQLIEGQK